jgi:hypothetical protein
MIRLQDEFIVDGKNRLWKWNPTTKRHALFNNHFMFSRSEHQVQFGHILTDQGDMFNVTTQQLVHLTYPASSIRLIPSYMACLDFDDSLIEFHVVLLTMNGDLMIGSASAEFNTFYDQLTFHEFFTVNGIEKVEQLIDCRRYNQNLIMIVMTKEKCLRISTRISNNHIIVGVDDIEELNIPASVVIGYDANYVYTPKVMYAIGNDCTLYPVSTIFNIIKSIPVKNSECIDHYILDNMGCVYIHRQSINTSSRNSSVWSIIQRWMGSNSSKSEYEIEACSNEIVKVLNRQDKWIDLVPLLDEAGNTTVGLVNGNGSVFAINDQFFITSTSINNQILKKI